MEKLSDEETKRLYYQLGKEIEFLRCYSLKVLCDGEYQALFTKENFKPLHDVDDKLTVLKSKLEDRMFMKGFKWADTHVFYGHSQEIAPIIKQTREQIARLDY